MDTRFFSLLLLSSILGVSGLAAQPASNDALRALDGEWLYVEDRTEGRTLEEQQPGMNPIFAVRVEEQAVVVLRGQGSERREIRIALDGSTSEIAGPRSKTRYQGAWKDGALEYVTELLREDGSPGNVIRTELRPTAEGLLVRVGVYGSESVALYRHPTDIPLPAPAKAAANDLAWLAGAWVGKRGAEGATSVEERWSPPLGGAMLGVSRTVSRNKMSAFEYLRVVERDGGLVYIAQPNGGKGTEFTLTEVSGKRAVFVNPRHDFPQRIVYELSGEGRLTASIGFAKGGRPRAFEFQREGN